MSEIGQQLEFYEELYEQAELIDKVLLEIKVNQNTQDAVSSNELGEMLVSLSSKEWENSPARLFIILMRDFKRSQRLEWATVGEKLISHQYDETTISKLENLASALEQEQTNVMARIKGF
jgi:hypothetical protein